MKIHVSNKKWPVPRVILQAAHLKVSTPNQKVCVDPFGSFAISLEAEAKKVKDHFLANWLKISHSTPAGLSEYHSGGKCKKRIMGLPTLEESRSWNDGCSGDASQGEA